MGFYASVRTYSDFFAFHGFENDQARVREAFGAGVSADDLADHVSDRMVDALTLSGTVDDVRKKLRAYDGVATSMKLTPPTHGLTAEQTRQAQHQLIELIAGLTERRRQRDPLEDVRSSRWSSTVQGPSARSILQTSAPK